MSVKRIFLPWDRPALAEAVDYLVRHYGSARELDLAGVVVVVPGSRAGRRLLELLVDLAERQHLPLTPPTIVTVGRLPELLYTAKRPFANDLVQQLTWSESLRRSPPEVLERLMAVPPTDGDLMAWLSLGEVLGRLHRELAADKLNFTDVAKECADASTARECQRWQALAAVQRQYLDTLDALELWDLQTARLTAIQNKECQTDSQIVLVGTVDLNKTQRAMLDQLPPDQVTALIFSPPELADCFDEHGCLCPESWREMPIPLATDQIVVAENPTDQAAAVIRALADLKGKYCGEEITIGTPDREVVPFIEQYLEQSGVPSRYAAGRPIAQTAPYRLIDVVANFLESRRFSTLAAFVRHPSVEKWLDAQTNIRGDWLSELDGYYGEHLPYQLGSQWLGDGKGCANVKKICRAVDQLLEPFTNPRALNAWSQPIADLLVAIFGQTPLDQNVEPDRTILAACRQLHDLLREQMEIPESLMPTVTGAEALRLVQRRVEGGAIAPVVRRGAVELLGWLELPLDDAPALIVTGFNEGKIPASLNADLFLPNQMRRALKIEDNDRRYARDAYALTLLIKSHAALKLIVGRRSAEGEPLTPSRLVFACDDQTIAQRVLRCFSSERQPANAAPLPGALRPGQLLSQFSPPLPKPLKPITSMRVTEFKDYLGCPYRYYLKHQLKLAPLADGADELDGAAFGSLAHRALSEFGQSPAASSADLEEVIAYLNEGLDRALTEVYGKTPLPAIRVQAEQLRARLKAFARWQADWARQGWRIEYVETSPEEGKAALVVDGKPMLLRGRVDRIDLHEPSGKRMIFDYKFSDRALPPDRTHRQKGRWVDLQLPLYRHLVVGLGIEGPIDLGYLVLPKDTSRVGHLLADWSETDLRDADHTAAEVVRAVREQRFWPPATTPPPFSEIYAAICHDDQFGALATAAEEEGATEL
jgi:hypothetical protein